MSKYPEIDVSKLRPNDTLSQALSYINPNNTVLECGCASGYVTRYLKETLNCKVSIVEIDKEGFEKASNYSVDGFYGDLNQMQWYEYYKNKKFDYILFTDVLEHLINPQKTLLYARELLTDNGQIIISIPNICHNDIIIRMFYNYFTYTNTGLLDNTHIHFWGLNDIEAFCNEAGLKVMEIKASSCNTNRTEQAIPLDDIDPDLLKLLLEKRKNGTIYQFIILCKKNWRN